MRTHMLVQADFRLTGHRITVLSVMISIGLCGPARGEEQPSACCRNLVEFAARLIPVTDSELDEMEDRLVSWLAVTDGPECRRPMLRGAPTPGSGSARMGRLFEEGVPGLERCEAYLIEHSDELNDSRTGTKPAPELEREAAGLCAGIVPALTEAVRYESNCAPYMQGDDEFPSAHTRMIRLFKAAAIWLRFAAGDGDIREVLQVGTDLLRLAQDVTRGRRSGLVPAMISMACFRMVAEFGLREVLNETKSLPVDALDAFIREIDVLLGTDPGFGAIMETDYRLMMLDTWLPCLRGEDWEVPGAIRDLSTAIRPLSDIFDDGNPESQRRWACAWSWAGTEQMAASVGRACPDGVLGRECLKGFRQEEKRTALRKFLPLALWHSFSGGNPVATFRNITAAEEEWLFSRKYVAKWTLRSFDLAALRLHAAVRKRQAETGECPAIKELTGLAWADLLRDPNTGEPMEITADGSDGFKVRPSKLFEDPDVEKYRDIDYEIRCLELSHSRADDDDVFAPLACSACVWRDSDQKFSHYIRPMVASSLAKVGEIDRALETADAIHRTHPKAEAYFSILEFEGPRLPPEMRMQVLLRLYNTLSLAGPFAPVAQDSGKVQGAVMRVASLALTGLEFAKVEMPGFARTCLELSEQRIQHLPVEMHFFLLDDIAFGHALLGDEGRCERMLDRVMDLVEDAAEWRSRTVMLSFIAGSAASAGLKKYVDRYLKMDEERLWRKGEKLDGSGAALYVDTLSANIG